MSEYEETDSLTLAVAKAITEALSGMDEVYVVPDADFGLTIVDGAVDMTTVALAAIKAYELHQVLKNRDLP